MSIKGGTELSKCSAGVGRKMETESQELSIQKDGPNLKTRNGMRGLVH